MSEERVSEQGVTELIANRYALHDQLGRGGMGSVYRATDLLTGQVVALKRVILGDEAALQGSYEASQGVRLALAREFKMLASLRHPHIITVLDYGFDKDRYPFFTMEYLPDSRSFTEAGGDQTFTVQINLLVHLLQAIAYLHRRGILHRDLKPANVLVTPEGLPKVLDFGLAVNRDEIETKDDEFAGTLTYIAPEVFQGAPPSRASDLYALGVMMYELFSGHVPFHEVANNLNHLLYSVMTVEPDMSPIEAWARAYLDTHGDGSLPASVSEENPPEGSAPPADDAAIPGDQTVAFGDVLPPDQAVSFDELAPPDQTVPFGVMLPRREPGEPPAPMTMSSGWLSSPTTSEDKDVVAIVRRLLQKTVEARYDDAYAVLADLVQALGRPFPEESKAIRESYLQAAAFVGREAEMSRLNAALEDILHSDKPTGSLWLLGGESGVGKTRLLEELRAYALVQGVTVLHGQAVEGGGMPYNLWREPLRRLILKTPPGDLDASILSDIVPDIDALLRREVSPPPRVADADYQQRITGTITSLFQQQTEPVLLLLEDLQWAMRSIGVLKVLSQMLPDLPILVVCSYRSDEAPNLPEQLPTAHTLRLERLNPEQIAELSVAMLGPSGSTPQVQELLVRETEGNVFFLVEIVRNLAEEAGRLDEVGRVTLPQTVFAGGIANIVARRLQRVPADDLVLLRIAAVAGREVDLRLLRTIVADKTYPELPTLDIDAWLTTCANLGVLEISDGIWRFSHDRLRQTTISNIDKARLPDVHRAVALGLEAAYPDSTEYYRPLATHWHVAGDTAREYHYARLAGNVSLNGGAFQQAIEYYRRALELHPQVAPGDAAAAAQIRISMGEALEIQGDYDNATLYLEEALTISREQGDQVSIGRALGVLADVAWRQSDYTRALSLCRESLETCRAAQYAPGIARAANRTGVIYYEQGEYDAAAASFNDGLAVAQAEQDPPMIATINNNLGLVAFAQGDYAAAGKFFAETLAMTRLTGERRKIAMSNMNLGVIAGEQGDLTDATEYMEETLRIFHDIGERRGVGLVLKNLGGLAEYQHDYVRAADYYAQSLEIYRALNEPQSIAATMAKVGHVQRILGNHPDSRKTYTEALDIARQIDALPTVVEILSGLAGVVDDPIYGLKLLGLALNHPAMPDNIRTDAQPLIALLSEDMQPDTAEKALQAGAALDLNETIHAILTEGGD